MHGCASTTGSEAVAGPGKPNTERGGVAAADGRAACTGEAESHAPGGASSRAGGGSCGACRRPARQAAGQAGAGPLELFSPLEPL